MPTIEFSAHQKSQIVEKIKAYFQKELSQEIEQFDAEFLLDFFSQNVGAYFYNQGLEDAKTVLESKVDLIVDGFYELEIPTEANNA